VWASPNTALGLAYGGVGYLYGAATGQDVKVSIGNNAIQFEGNPINPFDMNGAITLGNAINYVGNANPDSGKTLNYLWVKVVQVIGDGSNSGQGALDDGTGPIIFSNAIDSSSNPVEIIPKFISTFSYTFESALVNLCLNQRNFGLSFDKLYRKWNIISDSNLDLYRPFSLDLQNDTDNASRDASWLVSFTWTGKSYNVRYRSIDYIFESAAETAFFVDPNSINYDFVNDTVIKDRIDVLSINTAVQPLLAASTATVGSVGKDYQWQIDNAIVEADGYTEPKKVKVSFYDYNNAGQISDPDAFVNIVEPLTTSTVTGFLDKFVYFQKAAGATGYSLVDGEQFSAYPTPDDVPRAVLELAQSGDLYYFYDPAYNVINS
jgi:hypothetical protein